MKDYDPDLELDTDRMPLSPWRWVEEFTNVNLVGLVALPLESGIPNALTD